MRERDLLLSVGDIGSVKETSPRAVLLPFVGDNPGIFSRVVVPVINTGAMLIVVTDDYSDFATRIIDNFVGDDPERPVRILKTTEDVRIAQECAAFDVGREPNDKLVITGAYPETPERDMLFRRAFGDFERIAITSLDGDDAGGGKSGASLRRVDAIGFGGIAAQPFVTKIGLGKNIADEIDATKDFVMEYVPFQHRPPLVLNRCVIGPKFRMMTSMFIAGATRLDDFLLKHQPDGLIRRLLTGPLRGWRETPNTELLALGPAYEKYRLLPPAERLRVAATKHSPAPDELFARLHAIPPQEVRVCPSHGDLHLWNVFVTSNREIILIDFAATDRQSTHIARDLATLDVSLMFYVEPAKEEAFSEADLRVQYEDPLRCRRISAVAGSLSHRLSMLRDVRSEAEQCCLTGTEYRIAVACALLRYAAKEKNEQLLHQRSIAYDLAASLIWHE
jgi:hypothetical protein